MAGRNVHELGPFHGEIKEGPDDILAVMSEGVRSEAIDPILGLATMACLKSPYRVDRFKFQERVEIGTMLATYGDKELAPLAKGEGGLQGGHGAHFEE